MIDLLIGYGLSIWDYNKPWISTTGRDDKPTDWINYNATILLGGASTFILPPFGSRSACVAGSDIKIVVDWIALFALLQGDNAVKTEPKNINKLNAIIGWPLGPPAGTSTDFIFGEKNLINYGRARDTTITRKKSPGIEIKNIQSNFKEDEPLFSKGHKFLISLPYLALIGLNLTTRLFYILGDKESKTIDIINIGLAGLTPRVQTCWIAGILTFERLIAFDKHVKDTKDTIDYYKKQFKVNMEAEISRLMTLPQNAVISVNLQARIDNEKQKIDDHLKLSKKFLVEEMQKSFDFIKSLNTMLGDQKNNIVISNEKLVSYYNELTYITFGKIELEANIPGTSKTTLRLTPGKIDATSAGASLRIGDIDDTVGNVIIEVSDKDKSNIFIGFKGESFSHIDINKDMLQIESGSDNKKNPIIELSTGNLKLRCGPAGNGPEIVIENDKVTIKVGAAEASGSSFVMTDDSIELKVGDNSALKISRDGIDIGHGESSTKWNNAGVSLSVAESKMMIALTKIVEMSSTMKKTIDGVQSAQKTLSKDHGDAILELKAAVLKFN